MKNQDDPYLKNAIKRTFPPPDQVGIIYNKKYIYTVIVRVTGGTCETGYCEG